MHLCCIVFMLYCIFAVLYLCCVVFTIFILHDETEVIALVDAINALYILCTITPRCIQLHSAILTYEGV